MDSPSNCSSGNNSNTGLLGRTLARIEEGFPTKPGIIRIVLLSDGSIDKARDLPCQEIVGNAKRLEPIKEAELQWNVPRQPVIIKLKCIQIRTISETLGDLASKTV